MADSTHAASRSRRSAPVLASPISVKIVQAGQNVTRAESRHLTAMCDMLPAIDDPIALPLEGRQDSSSPVLNVSEPRPAFHAVMVANNFVSCPGMHFSSPWYAAVRKEGL